MSVVNGTSCASPNVVYRQLVKVNTPPKFLTCITPEINIKPNFCTIDYYNVQEILNFQVRLSITLFSNTCNTEGE